MAEPLKENVKERERERGKGGMEGGIGEEKAANGTNQKIENVFYDSLVGKEYKKRNGKERTGERDGNGMMI